MMRAVICCSSPIDEDVEAVSAMAADVVEREVGDLKDEIVEANLLLQWERADRLSRLEGGAVYLEQLHETVVSGRETAEMLLEDHDVGFQPVFVPLVRPPILEDYAAHLRDVEATHRFLEDAHFYTPLMRSNYDREREEAFVDSFGVSYADVQRIEDEHRERVASTVVQVQLPDGTVGVGSRPYAEIIIVPKRVGETTATPSWTREELQARVHQLRAVPAGFRRLIPSLVGAIVQDARSRWGLLPDVQANRLMVGHHMRKQLRNGSLAVSAVDTHVAVALNQFFVPHNIDVLANGQRLNWRSERMWVRYDTVGMSWWNRTFGRQARVATPVV